MAAPASTSAPTELQASQASLVQLLQETPQTVLKPLCFFVSWQGVLTLAYSGFPASLVNLKRRLQEHWPELPAEKPGSMWPKTTLAALKDGNRLTPEQLRELNAICKRCSVFTEKTFPATVNVRMASVAVFACRSLERCLSVQDVPLRWLDGPACDEAAAVADSEEARVAAIVAEADKPDYWFSASLDGNRESHYRGAALGCTLMIPFRPMTPEQQADDLLRFIGRFRGEVERALPDMYAWLDHHSYHITIRGIVD